LVAAAVVAAVIQVLLQALLQMVAEQAHLTRQTQPPVLVRQILVVVVAAGIQMALSVAVMEALA
jgi:hypothetical protein